MSASSLPQPLDPYDPVSVHGLWPLVADPGHPAGLRFAVMGRDAPTDCLSDPSGLPDAGVEIRTFPSTEAREAWLSAVGEFGGNAAVASPLDAEAIAAALVVRFDRPRATGGSLDECVALTGPLPSGLPYLRHRERLRIERNAREAGWRGAWATELSEAGYADLRVDTLNEKPSGDRLTLTFRARTVATCVRITRLPDGARLARLSLSPGLPAYPNDPDLAEAFRACVEGLGYGIDDGGPVRPFPDAGGMLAAVSSDVSALAGLRKRLDADLTARAVVRNALSERASTVLRRMADGFPVAKAPATSGYAFQVDPVTGKSVDVDGHALSCLWLAAAVVPVWWTGPAGADGHERPFDAYARSLWGPTPAGLALLSAEPDVPALARDLAGARAGRDALGAIRHAAPPFPGTSSAYPAWSPPPEAPGPPGGRKIPGRARDLALLAAWVQHGLSNPPTEDHP